jgi:hypothetical protein
MIVRSYTGNSLTSIYCSKRQPEVAAMDNSTLPTICGKLNVMSTTHMRKLITVLVRENGLTKYVEGNTRYAMTIGIRNVHAQHQLFSLYHCLLAQYDPFADNY